MSQKSFTERLNGVNGLYSFETIAKIISKDTGKNVNYQQIPVNAFKEQVPEPIAVEITEMFQFFDKYNLYGPQTKEVVEWAIQQVPDNLGTFEEFFERNPLGL